MSEKNLIIHLTRGSSDKLKKKLHLHSDFKDCYDGWETSIDSTTGRFLSTRLYYYNIPHDRVLGLLKHLRQVGTEHDYKIKIQPVGTGNHDFQEP